VKPKSSKREKLSKMCLPNTACLPAFALDSGMGTDLHKVETPFCDENIHYPEYQKQNLSLFDLVKILG